jgi:hypoxanthine phosphoribosyltransferase
MIDKDIGFYYPPSQFSLLYSEEQIDSAVNKLCNEVEKHYQLKLHCEGSTGMHQLPKPSVVALIVLKGGFMFGCQFLKQCKLCFETQFVIAKSYGENMTSQQWVDVTFLDNSGDWVKDRDILILDDIADTFLTLESIKNQLYSKEAKSVKTCVLLDKPLERKLLATRNMGIVVLGQEAAWALLPSFTPSAIGDQPEPLITNMGCVSKKGACIVGDDVYFFSQDGLRALKRTVQDKLQLGTSYPISYVLKTEFESIAWGYIGNLSMEYFDNKLFIAVPTSATAFDTWIYYPATNSFVIRKDWSPTCWARYKIDGEERLYQGIYGSGVVYRTWYGNNDNGATVNSTFAGKEEDFGKPLQYKYGGELEVEAEVAGSGDSLTVSVAIEGQNFQSLGTVSLNSSTAPTLPINLPFSLADSYIVRE